MMSIVVVADSDDALSTQFTLDPFRPSVTGLIVILDISGKLESLTKVIIMVELIILGAESTPAEPIDETCHNCVTAPLSGLTSCHICTTLDVLHITSS